jgi:secretion/DNA translocation related CpaE-like protein
MNDGRTIAVLGAGTGAGATTLLVALAMRAHAAGRRVGAVDADPCGGGLDVAFGIETAPGVRWEDLLGSDGPLDGERLMERLPADGGPRVMSFGRQWCTVPGELLDRALDGMRAVHDLLLVDVGRHLATPDSVAGYDELVLVARGTAAGLAAAGATAQRIERAPQLVVRGTGHAAAHEAADALGMQLAAVLPTDRRLAVDAERGVPAGSRRRSAYVAECDRLLRDLLLPGAVAA